MITVPLDVRHHTKAHDVGRARAEWSGRTPRYNGTDAKDIHYVGAHGEAAVAQQFDIVWDGALGDFRARDVGDFEVRTTRHSWGKLLIHGEDDPTAPFILAVYKDCQTIELIGWLWAAQGQRPEYWADPTGGNRPAYFIPQRYLHDFASLPL